MLRTLGEGGGEMKLPPWYDRETDDADALFAWLDSMTGKDFGEAKRGDKRP